MNAKLLQREPQYKMLESDPFFLCHVGPEPPNVKKAFGFPREVAIDNNPAIPRV
jgi:hypothetical protein